MRYLAIAFLFVGLLTLSMSAAALDRIPGRQELERIEEIRQMIAERGYSWEAGPTSVSHLSEQEL